MASSRLKVLLVLALSAAPLAAEQYPFQVYDQTAGLANPTVRAIQTDREGFIWIGTANGLFRYDGTRFRHYDTPGNRITALLSAPDGTFWAATETGLAQLEGDRFEAVNFGKKTMTVPGSLLAWHPTAGVLFTSSEGLVAINRGMLTWLQPRGAFAVDVDRQGRVWFGCPRAICRMDDWRRPDQVVRYTGYEGLPASARWHALQHDRQGRIWARCTEGVALLDPEQRFKAVNIEAHTSAFAGFYADRLGRLFAPSDQGLWIHQHDRWSLVDSTRGLPMDATLAVGEDREGAIWVGTAAAGLARWLGDGNWTTWTKSDGLPNAAVWSMIRDHRGRFWAGTNHGLVRYDAQPQTGKSRIWLRKDGLPDVRVHRLTEDDAGHVWLASGRELARIHADTGAVRRFGPAEGFESGGAYAVLADRAGWLWAAGLSAFYRARADAPVPKFEKLQPPGAPPNTWYFDLFEDAAGRLWVASSAGLYLREPQGDWRRYTQQEGLRNTAVSSVTQDAAGNMVVSYRDAHGLSILDPGQKWRHLETAQGLSSNKVHFVRRAGDAVWVGTDHGVDILRAGQLTHIDRESGLAWDDTNAGALLAEPDGTVWVGTTRGISRYQARHLPLPPAPPPVRIMSVRFGGQTAAQPGLQLPYRQRPAEFELAALTYDMPGRVRLDYRLAGFDDIWREAKQGQVVFPSLPAGKYRFEARARSAAGVWSTAPATYEFEILPPWWQTTWAIAFGITAAGGLVRLFLYWRMRVVLARQRRLEQAVVERTARIQEQKTEIEHLLVETQAANRHKTEFLANMSHEIRTPLNGVLGMSRLIARTNLDAEQRDYVEELETSTRWLTAMLNDILDYAKAEAGTLELESTPFRPRDVIEECKATFAPVAAAQRLELRTRVEGDSTVQGDTSVQGDPARLRQILSNLLNNAVKFTPAGSIDLVARCLPSGDPACARWEFSITDTGIGISPEKKQQVFEAFRQVDGSLTRRFGGTGLGLALCAKLAHIMGTRLEVESEEGKGSRFSFQIDFVPAPALPQHLQPRGDVPLRPLRVLLAEDNLVNQKVASRLLEKNGHHVTIANNGVEAVERFKAQPFDAVLMDIHMPEMDGFEATRLICAWQREQRLEVPVIALTARTMQGDRDEAINAGMAGYLSKPLEIRDLLAMLAKHTQPPVAA
jgi:signal transduction histidine kinase/CheY-like chemotaxis protein